MSDILWITGGRVIDPANQRDAIGDLYAIDGLLVESLSAAQQAAANKIDATGLVVAPGLVDIHRANTANMNVSRLMFFSEEVGAVNE